MIKNDFPMLVLSVVFILCLLSVVDARAKLVEKTKISNTKHNNHPTNYALKKAADINGFIQDGEKQLKILEKRLLDLNDNDVSATINILSKLFINKPDKYDENREKIKSTIKSLRSLKKIGDNLAKRKLDKLDAAYEKLLENHPELSRDIPKNKDIQNWSDKIFKDALVLKNVIYEKSAETHHELNALEKVRIHPNWKYYVFFAFLLFFYIILFYYLVHYKVKYEKYKEKHLDFKQDLNQKYQKLYSHDSKVFSEISKLNQLIHGPSEDIKNSLKELVYGKNDIINIFNMLNTKMDSLAEDMTHVKNVKKETIKEVINEIVNIREKKYIQEINGLKNENSEYIKKIKELEKQIEINENKLNPYIFNPSDLDMNKIGRFKNHVVYAASFVMYLRLRFDLIQLLDADKFEKENNASQFQIAVNACGFNEVKDRLNKNEATTGFKIDEEQGEDALTELFMLEWNSVLSSLFCAYGHWVVYFKALDPVFTEKIENIKFRMEKILEFNNICPHHIKLLERAPDNNDKYQIEFYNLGPIRKRDEFKTKIKEALQSHSEKQGDAVLSLVCHVAEWGCDVRFKKRTHLIIPSKLAVRGHGDAV